MTTIQQKTKGGRRKETVSICMLPAEAAALDARIQKLGKVVANRSHYFLLLAEYDQQHNLLKPLASPEQEQQHADHAEPLLKAARERLAKTSSKRTQPK